MANKTSESLLIVDDDTYNESKKEWKTTQLQKRELHRVEEIDRKKAAQEETEVTEEKSSFFIKHFQQELQNLQNMIECHGLSSQDRLIIVDHFDAIATSYQRLQKFFNDSVMFLPRFESRKAQSQLKDLQSKIEIKRLEMLPKKKFAFKSKSKNTTAKKNVAIKDISQLKENAAHAYTCKVAELKEDCEVRNKTGQTITLSDSEVHQKDIALSHLTNCKINIYGAPGTVHISDVEGCDFIIGPVSGSVFVDRCEKSSISTGCQQLRVHHTRDTDFYLHVTSRAIIEDTTSVRFAPYNVKYLDLDKHYKASGIDPNINNWSSVDDFNWLSIEAQSPNWKILEEGDRKLCH